MRKLISWLAWLGGAIATGATLLTTAWGVVVTALIAIIAAAWNSTFALIQDPRVIVAVAIFLVIYWVCIGVVVLRNSKRPRIVRIVPDYSYALALQGMGLLLDPKKPDGFGLGFSFQNVANSALRAEVQDLRIIVDGRTADYPDINRVFVISRAGSKTHRSPFIPRDSDKTEVEGTAEIIIHYGHPENEPVRRYRLRLSVNIRFGENPNYTDSIMIETDEPLAIEVRPSESRDSRLLLGTE